MIKRILAATVLTGGLAAGAVGIGAGAASADYWASYYYLSDCQYNGYNVNDWSYWHYDHYRCDYNSSSGMWDLIVW
ncbi:hypothetical protein [Nocardia sp. NPDC004722]